jgi:hypothetical protein
MACTSFRLPCMKFLAAFLISLICLIFGCLMLAFGKEGTMSSFYTSLISSALIFWCHPPRYNDDDNDSFHGVN